MSRLKRIGNDIRRRRFLDAYAAFLLTAFVIAVDIAAGYISGSWVISLVSAAVILLLGIITLNTVEIRRGLEESQERLKLWRFHPSRESLPSLTEQLAGCRKHSRMFAIQFGTIQGVQDLLLHVEEKAKAGVRIDMAILSPVHRDGSRVLWLDDFGYAHNFKDLEPRLLESARLLKQWYDDKDLDPAAKRNVNIRAITAIPTASVIFWDEESANGYIHVEPVMFRMNPAQRPSFWVRRGDDAKLFERLVDAYAVLWDEAIPIQELPVGHTVAKIPAQAS